MEDLECMALTAMEASLSLAKWRLKPASRRRLQTDVLALCTGMRPVIMVDYGGKMPELLERLCKFLKFMQKESDIFWSLRVMVIEDMIYLIHAEGIAEFAASSLNSERELLFVDLQQNPPKKEFSLKFPVGSYGTCTTELLLNSQSSEFIDLSDCMRDTQVTIPTLNGWLLGYPVVYLLCKEHVADSINNLSTKSLNLFKVVSGRRNGLSSGGYQEDELMSFSVPCDLSIEGWGEPWAQEFEGLMREKWENCKQVWHSLRMEVGVCHPQATTIVL